MPGLLMSPAKTGTDNAIRISSRERKRLMETSVTHSNHQDLELVAKDTTPIGDEFKDHWARLAREGDLRASIKLAACYEIAGELDNGLAVITEFLKRDDLSDELRAEGLLREAVLREDSPAAAWKVINKASLEVRSDLRWKLHNQRGRILKEMKQYDSAIIEYTATAYYAELAGSIQSVGIAHNNLASIYRIKGMYTEAHEAVDRAIELLRGNEYLAHALDQKALNNIAEKKYQSANHFALEALCKTSQDHRRWRADFLCTCALAEAGLGRAAGAATSIENALDICDYLSDENLRLKVTLSARTVYEMLYQSTYDAAITLALKTTDGKLRQAAKKLGMAHPSLLKAMKKHSLK